jgi:hypothetical protein
MTGLTGSVKEFEVFIIQQQSFLIGKKSMNKLEQ